MDHDNGLLLGKHTPVVEVYSPELLYPIPRSLARSTLGIAEDLPFYGADLWHAYELSWLDATGKPVARVGRFTVPATTTHIVESKSFKLYLNSLNNTRFDSDDAAQMCIERDISAAAGGDVSLEILAADAADLAGIELQGNCLDECKIGEITPEPRADTLILDKGDVVQESLFSHLLRSLCPVTGQPDWATVWVRYRGQSIDHSALLTYIVSYRQHQEYHEQCVERMFLDISNHCQPELLHIQAFYTRRGGLDINPSRSTDPAVKPIPRLNRQ